MGRTFIDCCHKCTERQADPNCHGYCERYLKQKAEFDANMAEKRKKIDAAVSIAGQRFDCYEKVMKRRNHR